MLRSHVDFSKILRPWDGFGVTLNSIPSLSLPQNINSAGEPDISTHPGLYFGTDGLQANIVRIYLDPFHQKKTEARNTEEIPVEADEYDHEASALRLREFCVAAQTELQKQGQKLQIITTCLSPPEWMTKQKEISGRDLDPLHRAEYARYMVSWLKFLVEKESLPVKYMSLHRKGEMWNRWNEQGGVKESEFYNLYWPPEHVTDFLKLVKKMIIKNSLAVGLTPGETGSWVSFQDWGYADAIVDDPQAIASLDLLCSYGSYSGRDCLDCRSAAIDLIRQQRPDIHAWVILEPCRETGTTPAWLIHDYIYGAKVNAVILDCLPEEENCSEGTGSSPADFLKPVFRAGQSGKSVCQTACNCPGISIAAFSGNMSGVSDSFVIVNSSDAERALPVEIRGTASSKFEVFRTSPQEKNIPLGFIPVREGKVMYMAPAKSVSSFFGSV
ncbi:MAG: hypothetical protein GX556_00865 [Fibrobacter sp.]|nr:hypothetical protein [Fibrobacter sp.]